MLSQLDGLLIDWNDRLVDYVAAEFKAKHGADPRQSPATLQMLRHDTEIPSDEILLIQQARERLATHPDEALKWYNRARYALDAEDSPIASEIRHRHDVLAVWEYLERTLPLTTIVRVFERKS